MFALNKAKDPILLEPPWCWDTSLYTYIPACPTLCFVLHLHSSHIGMGTLVKWLWKLQLYTSWGHHIREGWSTPRHWLSDCCLAFSPFLWKIKAHWVSGTMWLWTVLIVAFFLFDKGHLFKRPSASISQLMVLMQRWANTPARCFWTAVFTTLLACSGVGHEDGHSVIPLLHVPKPIRPG